MKDIIPYVKAKIKLYISTEKCLVYCPVGFPFTSKNGTVINCSETQNCMAGYECMVIGEKSYCCPKLGITTVSTL